jgi:hypothetical protein
MGSAPIPVFGIPVSNRPSCMAIDSQFISVIALIHPLQARASSSKDGLHLPSKFLNRQTNWHYWLKQKLPEVSAQSVL